MVEPSDSSDRGALDRRKAELEIEKMIAEIEKLRADARKAEMETRVEPWRLVVGAFAAGAAFFGAAVAAARYLLF